MPCQESQQTVTSTSDEAVPTELSQTQSCEGSSNERETQSSSSSIYNQRDLPQGTTSFLLTNSVPRRNKKKLHKMNADRNVKYTRASSAGSATSRSNSVTTRSCSRSSSHITDDVKDVSKYKDSRPQMGMDLAPAVVGFYDTEFHGSGTSAKIPAYKSKARRSFGGWPALPNNAIATGVGDHQGGSNYVQLARYPVQRYESEDGYMTDLSDNQNERSHQSRESRPRDRRPVMRQTPVFVLDQATFNNTTQQQQNTGSSNRAPNRSNYAHSNNGYRSYGNNSTASNSSGAKRHNNPNNTVNNYKYPNSKNKHFPPPAPKPSSNNKSRSGNAKRSEHQSSSNQTQSQTSGEQNEQPCSYQPPSQVNQSSNNTQHLGYNYTGANGGAVGSNTGTSNAKPHNTQYYSGQNTQNNYNGHGLSNYGNGTPYFQGNGSNGVNPMNSHAIPTIVNCYSREVRPHNVQNPANRVDAGGAYNLHSFSQLSLNEKPDEGKEITTDGKELDVTTELHNQIAEELARAKEMEIPVNVDQGRFKSKLNPQARTFSPSIIVDGKVYRMQNDGGSTSFILTDPGPSSTVLTNPKYVIPTDDYSSQDSAPEPTPSYPTWSTIADQQNAPARSGPEHAQRTTGEQYAAAQAYTSSSAASYSTATPSNAEQQNPYMSQYQQSPAQYLAPNGQHYPQANFPSGFCYPSGNQYPAYPPNYPHSILSTSQNPTQNVHPSQHQPVNGYAIPSAGHIETAPVEPILQPYCPPFVQIDTTNPVYNPYTPQSPFPQLVTPPGPNSPMAGACNLPLPVHPHIVYTAAENQPHPRFISQQDTPVMNLQAYFVTQETDNPNPLPYTTDYSSDSANKKGQQNKQDVNARDCPDNLNGEKLIKDVFSKIIKLIRGTGNGMSDTELIEKLLLSDKARAPTRETCQNASKPNNTNQKNSLRLNSSGEEDCGDSEDSDQPQKEQPNR